MGEEDIYWADCGNQSAWYVGKRTHDIIAFRKDWDLLSTDEENLLTPTFITFTAGWYCIGVF